MPWRPDYITVAQAAAYLQIPAGDTVDDTELQVWVTSASRAIDRFCNRQFGQLAAPAARVYTRPAVYDPVEGLWCQDIDDVQDLTGATVNGLAFASAGAVMLPRNAPADAMPWERIGFTSMPAMTAPGAPVVSTLFMRWGWAAQPAQVGGAARLQVNRWNFRRNAPAGYAGSPDSGSEQRLFSKLDPDVKTTLLGLRRRRMVA